MSENTFPFDKFLSLNNNSSNFNDLDGKTSKNISHMITNDGDESNGEQLFGQEEINSISAELLETLKSKISPQKYKAFFRNSLSIKEIKTDKLILSTTSDFIKNMIKTHYLQVLKDTVYELLEMQVDIDFEIISKANMPVLDTVKSLENKKKIASTQRTTTKRRPSFQIDTNITPTSQTIEATVDSKVIRHMNDSFGQRIDLKKSFENFIIGPSNNMAHAFSLSVAKDPGKVYSQLYLYGNSGLGKTHLLHSICNYLAKHRPELRVCFTTANAFFNEMVDRIKSREDDKFRRKYTQQVDVLIIDDIHEISNKHRTQNEFFHIFNELESKKKQLIFTSDKTPAEIIGFEERVRTRLAKAVLVEIQQPDLETRMAILKHKAVEQDIYLSDDVLSLIAKCVKKSIRELEGKLITLGAYSQMMQVDIDLEMAKEKLGLYEDYDEKIITMDSICRAVAAYYKIPIGDLRGKSRMKIVTHARHIAMYMTHRILKGTLEEIGDYYSKRDHTSIIHGVKKIERQLKEDDGLSQIIYEIESNL